jgi:hypothetical protein
VKQLTDGDEVLSLTHWPPFTPQEDSWYSFLMEAESTPRAVVQLDMKFFMNIKGSMKMDRMGNIYLEILELKIR